MLIAYLVTNIQIIDNFTELYWSISNLAKISLLIGAPLLILQTLTQYQPLVGNLLSTRHSHSRLSLVYFWLVEDFKDIIDRTNVKTF
jgi:hypothetical protein